MKEQHMDKVKTEIKQKRVLVFGYKPGNTITFMEDFEEISSHGVKKSIVVGIDIVV